MQKLSMDEMKKVMGGEEAPPSTCGLSCKTAEDCKQVLAGDACVSCTDDKGQTFNACS